MSDSHPKTPTLPEGCGYQGYEFGAGSYPDSICFGGKLYDADSGEHGEDGFMYYEPAEDIPCPMCREKEAIAYWTQRNMSTGRDRGEAGKAARSLVADIRRNHANAD